MSLIFPSRRIAIALGTLAATLLTALPVADAQSSALSSGSSGLTGSSTGYPAITPDHTTPLQVGGREALISLPEDYDPALTYPVLLAFGGYGVSPEQMSSDTGLQNASDAIVAYARGFNNAWAGAPYSASTMEEDIDFARQIVDALAAEHLIDRSRIYAIGHSNGGAFAIGLACRAPDLLAGAVSVSGMFYEGIDSDAACLGSPVPVMLIHATNDNVARPEGGVWRERNVDSTASVLQRWAHRNVCLSETEEKFTFAPDSTHTSWVGCQSDTEYLLSNSAGHGWPHHAPFEAWDFLSRQSR
ncbi:MAG: prolyl oligopeptidase family serine peptidase [Corynebacterium sp.]|uniref:alpha/beta hydrolase family esterase n=1 Tax=Corynebacterium sp. TaxID=1720 RepID=UPI0026DF195E|nr:prolyl oligopeptidase family serine peptidase [Corynebacterium sp.]MDO5671060.1 prolyl oligopeptidase family serine peptidase [Corynebacterium sp.]